MRLRRHIFVLPLAIAAAVGAAPATGSSEPSARVWLTTGDQQSLLAEQPASALSAPVDGAPTVTVDPSQTYQRIEGFGASITDSSAHLLATSPQRDEIMRELFDPRRGLGLSYLRQPMGASDFVAGAHYTYDDLLAGQTDFGMRRFSTAHDRAEILPLLREARALNPALRILATPWSPPAWMKTSGSLVGGRFIDDPRYYEAYARYFVRFVGVPARGRAGGRAHAPERAAEPAPERLSGDGLPRQRGGPAGQRARASAATRRTRPAAARLRPQLVAASERRRPARRPGQPRVRALAARGSERPPLPGGDGVPLLLRRPGAPVTAARRAPRTRTSTSPSARARSPATLRRRSPTRCTGTRATSRSAPSATGRRR